MDKMMNKYAIKAKSEVRKPQVFNGLVMSIFVYWALWFSTSLIMHLAK
jgi:hypothetical protein